MSGLDLIKLCCMLVIYIYIVIYPPQAPKSRKSSSVPKDGKRGK